MTRRRTACAVSVCRVLNYVQHIIIVYTRRGVFIVLLPRLRCNNMSGRTWEHCYPRFIFICSLIFSKIRLQKINFKNVIITKSRSRWTNLELNRQHTSWFRRLLSNTTTVIKYKVSLKSKKSNIKFVRQNSFINIHRLFFCFAH